jgi:hypothetical protein
VARAAVAVACPCFDLIFFSYLFTFGGDVRGASASVAGVLNCSFLRACSLVQAKADAPSSAAASKSDG